MHGDCGNFRIASLTLAVSRSYYFPQFAVIAFGNPQFRALSGTRINTHSPTGVCKAPACLLDQGVIPREESHQEPPQRF